MIDDLATVFGIFLKYGLYFFFIFIAFAVASSVFTKLRDEPAMFFKLLLVTLTPFAAAIGIPYFLLYEVFGFPFLLNVLVGFAIYALSTDFFEKRVKVKFKDE